MTLSDIEREGCDPGLDNHSARPIYRLAQAIKRPRTSHDPPPDIFVDRASDDLVAKTRATITNDLDRSSQSGPVEGKVQDDRAKSISSSKVNGQRTLQVRRIFHLAVTKGSPLSRVSSTSSVHSLSKRRGKHGPAIAVFTEKRVRRVDQMARTIVSSRPETPGTVNDEGSVYNISRKRPSASAQTLKALTPSSSILFDKEEDMDFNLKLATELQQFALETLTPLSHTAQPAANSSQSFTRKLVKYQPKPPRPRHTRMVENPANASIQQSPSITGDTLAEDASDEWVYDIYIRDVAQPLTQAKNQSAELQTNGNSQDENIGVIVIRQEDEEALEEFMSDGDGSEEWGEGDEDSNGELCPITETVSSDQFDSKLRSIMVTTIPMNWIATMNGILILGVTEKMAWMIITTYLMANEINKCRSICPKPCNWQSQEQAILISIGACCGCCGVSNHLP